MSPPSEREPDFMHVEAREVLPVVLAVLSAWGPAAADPADVVLDGMCNVDDLLVVISAWGACP